MKITAFLGFGERPLLLFSFFFLSKWGKWLYKKIFLFLIRKEKVRDTANEHKVGFTTINPKQKEKASQQHNPNGKMQ